MMSPEHLVMPASKTAQKQNSKNINRSVSEEHRNQQKELPIVKGEITSNNKINPVGLNCNPKYTLNIYEAILI